MFSHTIPCLTKEFRMLKQIKFNAINLTLTAILTVFIIACIMTLPLVNRNAKGTTQPQQENIAVRNKTGALEVLESRVENSILKVKMKNVSNRNITTYEVSLGGGKSAQTELLYTNEVITPGEIFDEEYPVDEDLIRDGFTIAAVVFEDGMGNGDTKVIQQITDIRYGERLQYQRSLPLLEQAANTPDDQLSEKLDQLASQISIDEIPNANLSSYVKSGIQNAKNHLIQEFKTIKEEGRRKGNRKAKEKLLELKQRKQLLINNLSIINK